MINARIHHFKKQTQKLNLEFIEAEMELERAKQAVCQGKPVAVTPPAASVPAAEQSVSPDSPEPRTVSATPQPGVVVVRPFADGVGYALTTEGTSLWFDNEIHAINYAQDVFPHCDIAILRSDGTARHRYSATSSEAP